MGQQWPRVGLPGRPAPIPPSESPSALTRSFDGPSPCRTPSRRSRRQVGRREGAGSRVSSVTSAAMSRADTISVTSGAGWCGMTRPAGSKPRTRSPSKRNPSPRRMVSRCIAAFSQQSDKPVTPRLTGADCSRWTASRTTGPTPRPCRCAAHVLAPARGRPQVTRRTPNRASVDPRAHGRHIALMPNWLMRTG